MNKDELKELLKENLSVVINVETRTFAIDCKPKTKFKVEILFDGEVICEDEDKI